GEAQRLVRRLGGHALGFVALALARLGGERGAHLAEGVLDRLLVAGERLALARLRRLGARFEPAAGEDRLRQRQADRPEARAAGEELRQPGALAAERGGERDRGEHLGARRGDARVGGEQLALRLDEVRA